jgi:hypothetical protein
MTVVAEAQNGDVVAQGLEDLNGEFLKVGRLRLFRIMQSIRREITRPPHRWMGNWEPRTYKQWKYVKFAISRGLMKVPYKRTGAYRKSWRIIRTEDGYQLVGAGYWLSGTGMRVGQPAITLIGGDPEGLGQSFMHQNRWALVADVVAEESLSATVQIGRDLGITAKQRGYPWE